jgi:predicted  nucleic acid-binding Zn-ribbon protein
MDIKAIFREGIKEFKRKNNLRKEKRKLKDKQKQYSNHLTALGKKAWESQIDIDQYGTLEKQIASTQDQEEELKNQQEQLNSQLKEVEEKRTKENDQFNDQRKILEDKKQEVDDRLNDKKKIRKEAQRTYDSSKSKRSYIQKEEESLKQKASNPETSDEEKESIKDKLAAFEIEKKELNRKIDESGESIDTSTEEITPLEEESDNFQKDIDALRADQKRVIGDLDTSISELNTQLDQCRKKLEKITQEQSENFEQLGQQLAGAKVENSEVSSEMNEVQHTEKEIANINKEINRLEQLSTSESRSAFQKMIGITAAGVLVLIGLIVLFMWLFGGKKNTDPAQAFQKEVKKNVPAPLADIINKTQKQSGQPNTNLPGNKPVSPGDIDSAMKDFNNATGEMKKQADKLYGKEIKVADRDTLMASLPRISGWEMKEPKYHAQQFGQLKGSQLSATYIGPNSQPIQVDITDTGHASAVLAPYLMMMNMNINKEDDNGYEKVTTYNKTQVIEKFNKKYNRGRLTFIAKKRYLIGLKTTGKNSIEQLKEFLKQFDLSKLQ